MGNSVDERTAAEQLIGELFVPTKTRDAVVARVAAELARRHFNTLVMHPPDPIVHPRVRLFTQYDSSWSALFLRAPGERNTFHENESKNTNPPTPDPVIRIDNDGWKDNGCFPTCVAMITRWWAEDNLETKGQLQYPFPGSNAKFDPIEACRRLFGRPYAPCMQIPVPQAEQANRAGRAFNDSTHEWVVNQGAILQAFCSITRPLRPFEGMPESGSVEQIMNQNMGPLTTFRRISLRHHRVATEDTHHKMDHEERRTALKAALQYGPVIVGLKYPGHFVVVDAHRGHQISICDPGAVLVNPVDWDTPPDRRSNDLPEGAVPDSGYVRIDDQKSYQAHGVTFHDKWLMQITSIDQFYASQDDIHPEWSNLEVTQ